LRFGQGDVSLEELILRHALGGADEIPKREAWASGVMMIPIPRPGILRQVGGREAARAIPGVEEIRITVPRGERVWPPPEGARYLGFIFARAATADEVEHSLRASHTALKVEIEALEPSIPLAPEPQPHRGRERT
jgi:hypothetical protein